MGRKVSPVPRRLTKQFLVRRWAKAHSDSVADFTIEHELARGQVIIKKLETLCAIYERGGINDSEVYGMAVTLLHDPYAIEENEHGELPTETTDRS